MYARCNCFAWHVVVGVTCGVWQCDGMCAQSVCVLQTYKKSRRLLFKKYIRIALLARACVFVHVCLQVRLSILQIVYFFKKQSF